MVIIQGDYEKSLRYCKEILKGSYFEFTFSFVSQNEVFRELDRFLWESRHCMRYQNEYLGNVVIDLTGWNDRSEHEFGEYFDAFMYYLQSKTEKINASFIVCGTCSEELFNALSKHFEVKIVEPGKGEIRPEKSRVMIGFGNREG